MEDHIKDGGARKETSTTADHSLFCLVEAGGTGGGSYPSIIRQQQQAETG